MIYAKRITGKWKKAFSELESVSGFEPMYQDDVDRGEMTLTECWNANIKWLEDMLATCTNISTPNTGN